MNVAVAQMNTQSGALSETYERMLAYAERAKEQHAELIVYPAPSLTGLMSLTDVTVEGFLEDLFATLKQLAENLPLPAVVPVVVTKDHEVLSEAMFLRQGHVTPLRLTAEIAHLSALARESVTEGDLSDEEDPGFDLPHFEWGDYTIGISFSCQDLDAWRDADQTADLMLYLNTSGYALSDVNTTMGLGLSDSRFSSDADELGAWVIGVNAVGLYGGHVSIGSSFVIAPDGECGICAKAFEEDLICVDIDSGSRSKEALSLPASEDTSAVGWKALKLGLFEFVKQGHFDGVAVLLDTSVSAQVTAALARSVFQASQIYISSVETQDQLEYDIAYARLAAYARENNLLVLTTENKSDWALGAGGMIAAGALHPLGDLYLSEILDFCESVPEVKAALSATVTYEVFDFKKKDELFSSFYEQAHFVDTVLSRTIELGKSFHEIVAKIGYEEAVADVLDALYGNGVTRQNRGSLLILLQCPLVDTELPLFTSWRDSQRKQTVEEDTSTLFDGLLASAEHAFMQAIPEQVEMPSPESLQEILDYLREFSGLEGAGVMFGMPKMWRGPFSEN